ncbi:Trm112 family protein [Thermodesulfobacterium sp. TA1]|uniref:Trm112 family protein n=1 Tax=Thermodesulfobacterium sp. TA1 TaxID=2234087 RepID=UPI0012320266|nr:Trm112 family protein [Thermodesulfobacterium sp. TA1]QER42406.1 Trm112 family protein [Thermodesulfobacterium sp. TA1]
MDQERIKVYLEVLACPKCKGDLEFLNFKDKEGFYCKVCKLFYPVIEDIPVMLVEEALKIENLTS